MFTTRRGFAALISGSIASAGVLGVAAARGDEPPNVFISPAGEPFRAPPGAPYPIADWFRRADKNKDGKLDENEFVADAAAFFAVLDLRERGVLDSADIAIYEHRIAPEVLGERVTVYAERRSRRLPGDGARLWLAQYGPMEGGPMGGGDQGAGPFGPGGPGQAARGGPQEGDVVPQDVQPTTPRRGGGDGLGAGGASPYSLLRTPEPVTAADPDFVVTGVVRKVRFLDHARDDFALLDSRRDGYLTLAGLPRTPIERLIGRPRRRL